MGAGLYLSALHSVAQFVLSPPFQAHFLCSPPLHQNLQWATHCINILALSCLGAFANSALDVLTLGTKCCNPISLSNPSSVITSPTSQIPLAEINHFLLCILIVFCLGLNHRHDSYCLYFCCTRFWSTCLFILLIWSSTEQRCTIYLLFLLCILLLVLRILT